MPCKKTGLLKALVEEYGKEKGEKVYYALEGKKKKTIKRKKKR